MIHLPPDPHLLTSFANSNLPWWKALAELVDNSLDAGAARVVIDVTNRVLTVSDDGNGCEDITAVFKLGEHKRRKSAKRSLGRYGIGAKDAWLSCSDTMQVVTSRNGVETSMQVNYTEWMKSNWNVADPVSKPSSGSTGTSIILPLRAGKNMPAEDAFKMLAFTFTPAISRGVQIVKSIRGKRTALVPVEMPARNDVVQSVFETNGKQVKIDIGILPDGVSLERGPFWLIYDHRIIDDTSIGVKAYSHRRIAGTITLGDGWSLTKNKDDLSESYDDLADEIFNRIEHVLKKADQLAETIESSALRGELQQMLNAAVKDANERSKEKRNAGSTEGSVRPKNTGRKRANASKTQDGNGFVKMKSKGQRKGGYFLDWCEIDPSIFGKFDSTGMRVSLNLNSGAVNIAKAQSNRLALTVCALSLIADYCCRHDQNGNRLLKFQFSSFAQAMGFLVKDYSEGKTNGK